jgi:hypothetical protein
VSKLSLRQNIAGLVVIVLIVVIGCVLPFSLPPAKPKRLGQITDASRYSEIMTSIGDYPPIEHFPRQIPTHASLTRFYFHPRVFQGSGVLQLRVRLPNEDINELRQHYVERAKLTLEAKAVNDGIISEGEVPTTSFFTGDTEHGSFPDTYEIFVIDAMPLWEGDLVWNHGVSYGVAISDVLSEIVYWYEEW